MITYKDYKGSAKLEKSIELWELSNFSLEEVQTDIYLKSVNLQYNTLVRWNDGTKDSSTNCLMFQIQSFFQNILQNPFQKLFRYIFFHKKIKEFWLPQVYKNNEKKNAWSMSPFSHRPMKPAYYNVDCRIYTALLQFNNLKILMARVVFIWVNVAKDSSIPLLYWYILAFLAHFFGPNWDSWTWWCCSEMIDICHTALKL